MNFNTFKRKLLCLIERIKLSESDYRTMKAKSQMYDGMMSAVKISISPNNEKIKNNDGHIIWVTHRAKTVMIDVDVVEMLAAGGIHFSDKTEIIFKEAMHAEWVKDKNGLYSCSHCDSVCPYDVQADVIEYWDCPYCPKCGAIMNK